MISTRDVVNRHLKYFGQADLQGVLSDYAPGVVMFTPDGPLKGPDAIRPLFQALIAEFGKPGASFNMKLQSVDGDSLTSCGARKLPKMYTNWPRTRSLCGMARS